ncbi:oligopeptide ABC transporter substrate-binding protein [Spiroplasma helicoides]|uniref:Oligopeptide ABC transporter substrate-binding protein n=1 Tax=Spiroplasma helicoides TaxID=216938 RepID=A0A1B3SKL1_9MOLU|nr:ABC transporter substrate-binding protein [Spiroplasma helicoides]AOG60460.1 oligopeptide ABC transporter substrate-binding protein [Spiroplasma helicoides]
MFLTSKRLLASLSAISGLSLVSASVISCGFSLDKILNKEMPIDTYITTYKATPTSWNTAYTFEPINQNILANTSATSLGVDEYGRVYGDIYESNLNLSSDRVAINEDTKNDTVFTYKIRDNAKWYKWDGGGETPITVDDFDTAAEFIMRSATTQSQVTTLWLNFIKGAKEINDYLKEHTDASWYEAKTHAGNGGFGLTFDKNKKTVTYTLNKSAPYFESLLCYAAFSPIHVDGDRKTMSNTGDFKVPYYSGAYLPKEVISQNSMVLEKNENYWFKDLVTIKKIKYLYTSTKATTSTDRELFEAGNLSGFLVNNGDNQGWDRYIGSDIYHPTFSHVYDTPVIDSVSTSSLFFNTYNTLIDTGSEEEKQTAIKASKLLQNLNTRLWISTKLDRSVLIKYYSEKFDGGSDVSKMLRNVFTAPGVGIDSDGTDYYKYVEKQLQKTISSNSGNAETKIDLSDGVDAYKDKAQMYTGKTDEEILKQLKEYMLKEKIITNESDKFTLRVLLNPADNLTLNPKAINMYDRFNQIEGNPIQIKPVENVFEADQYVDLSNKGSFDLYNGNWWPDYADPGTFLNTLLVNGDNSYTTGTLRTFDYDASQKKYSVKNIIKSSASDEYAKNYQSYNDSIISIDQNESNIKKRYEKFAEQEANYLYKNFFLMPFYIRSAPKNYSVSYVVPYTTNYAFTYGSSALKDWSKILNNKVVSLEESEKQKQRGLDYKQEILNDKDKRKKDDINERNHILFKNS